MSIERVKKNLNKRRDVQGSKSIEATTKMLKEVGSEIDVLLVEDDEILLKQMVNLLSKFFRRVSVAMNGLEALNRLSERSYDLIITDLTMPLIDGFALIENIRQNDSEQNILVLSAHSESEKLLKLINMGIDGFLLKPVNMEIILHKLSQACREIAHKKELEKYIQILKQRDGECTVTLQIQEEEEITKGISATDFVKLYSHEIASVNEALEMIEDKFESFLLSQDKSVDYQNLSTLIGLLKEYVKHLDNFLEFQYLVNQLDELIDNLETLNININIEIWIPSFVLLFKNLEQLRKGVFESQDLENIHAYDKNFTRIFEHIQKDRDEALELLQGLLS